MSKIIYIPWIFSQGRIGDRVDKHKGYGFPGTVVAMFYTLRNEPRVVVELDKLGILHIFNPEQLKKEEVVCLQCPHREDEHFVSDHEHPSLQ